MQNRAFLVSRRYIMTSIRVLFVCHGRAMESQ
nr:MAG TPA: arsenate reductase [Caudoviricetes sp.]DAZ48148.1 MAG TPA: arsenate reductase [Caudoviricetes sp.]